MNIIKSLLKQDYGYEDSGEQVKIELKVTLSAAPHTITVYLVEGNEYSVTEIWALVLVAWNAHSWSASTPILTINYDDYLTTELSSSTSGLVFKSIEVFVREENPRSLELPMILGLSRVMLKVSGSVKISNADYWNEFPGVLPYMGTWRLPTEIDTGFGFSSQISADFFELNLNSEAVTDVTRNSVSNSPIFVARGMGFYVEALKRNLVEYYDKFIDFAKRGKIQAELDFVLFDDVNKTWTGYLYPPECMKTELIFPVEKLSRYKLAFIPSTAIEEE